jgi:hypothetical protein
MSRTATIDPVPDFDPSAHPPFQLTGPAPVIARTPDLCEKKPSVKKHDKKLFEALLKWLTKSSQRFAWARGAFTPMDPRSRLRPG